jgi:hypothetical protein
MKVTVSTPVAIHTTSTCIYPSMRSMGNDTSPWFWWMNQPKIINQIKAKTIPAATKKLAKEEVCTCCKLHGAKS